MTNKQLIEKLQELPPDAEVGYVWDGKIRSTVRLVWQAQNGMIALADHGQYVEGQEAPEKPEEAGLTRVEFIGVFNAWRTPYLEGS